MDEQRIVAVNILTLVDEPELKAALECAKRKGAKLIVAKLDRLGRKASYILRLIDESGVEFHICDQPDADKLTITILAAVAEREAENTSKRTKAALAVRNPRPFRAHSDFMNLET